ncbi:MAG: protein kinase, partial [Acidobacteriota bacterium]
RSDLFSLGVVMYELLTGHAPFTGETTADVLAALLLGEPRPLNRYSSKLPDSLQQIINRCLAKQAEQRYQSAREVGDELKRLKEELEFSARLKRSLPENDNVLAMTVGAIKDFNEQTTFATRAPVANVAEVAPTVRPTTAMPPAHKTSAGKLAAVFVGLRQRGKTLAAAVLLIVGLLGWRQYELGSRTSNDAAINSVAVLPLSNQIGDPQLEYLPDGITESLIDGLSQLPDLTVRPASMVLAYKGNEIDPVRAGEALKVDAVVSGQILREGERLIVEIRLLRTKNGVMLWSQKYEGRPAGILAVQEEISHELANSLRTRSGDNEKSRTAKSPTQNSEAYRLYTIGRTLWLKRSSDSTLKAIELFLQAIKLDNNYALAYVGLADAYSTLGSYSQGPPYEVY